MLVLALVASAYPVPTYTSEATRGLPVGSSDLVKVRIAADPPKATERLGAIRQPSEARSSQRRH